MGGVSERNLWCEISLPFRKAGQVFELAHNLERKTTSIPFYSMEQKTWPASSHASPYSAFRFNNHHQQLRRKCTSTLPNRTSRYNSTCSSSSSQAQSRQTWFREQPPQDFSSLPFDLLTKIAAPFTLLDLRSSSLVCRSWRDALQPLREAMLFVRWGKRFKHGRGGVRPNIHKALDSFLKGASRGSTLAMVDAGLIYWEMGYKDQGIALYIKAAQLGDPAAQCNLGISYLQAEPPNPKDAVKWLYKASIAGHVRAQYQIALCLRQGRGVERNLKEAAKWYLRAAEGGYVRAMYNTSLCYSYGEGLNHSREQARKWLKRAADRGHAKAQFERGLGLFSDGEMMKAVVYLELATRAGESAAATVKAIILQRLSSASRDRAMVLADCWRALPSPR